ncbi:MAG: PAS domain-containing protein [Deltaproteobacteria bacterium]|nr:PAS domain-containing protein [Deltaproteobacteria bacterium]
MSIQNLVLRSVNASEAEFDRISHALDENIGQVDSVLYGLKHGDARYGTSGFAENEEIIKSLNATEAGWGNVKTALKEFKDKKVSRSKRTEILDVLIPGLINQIDDNVRLMSAHYAANVMRMKTMTAAFAVFFVVCFLIMYLINRRIVVEPLENTVLGMECLAKGNYNYQLDEKGTVELADIAAYYNAAVAMLKDSIAHYIEILESLPDCVVELDRAGRIKYANHGAMRLLKKSGSGLLGARFGDFMDKSADLDYKAFLAAVFDGRPQEPREFGGSKDGIWDITAVPLASGGKIESALLVARDVSEKKRLMDEAVEARVRAEESEQKLKAAIKNLEDLAILAVKREMHKQEAGTFGSQTLRERGVKDDFREET